MLPGKCTKSSKRDMARNRPETVFFFAHPWHPLGLEQGPVNGRFCDICKHPVLSSFYCCIPCGFDVHPDCIDIQQKASAPSHPDALYLVPGIPNCNACNEIKGFWLYRCGVCNFNRHIECLHAPGVSTHSGHSMTTRGTSQTLPNSRNSLGKYISMILLHFGITVSSEILAEFFGNLISGSLGNN